MRNTAGRNGERHVRNRCLRRSDNRCEYMVIGDRVTVTNLSFKFAGSNHAVTETVRRRR
jgi:hypothetical protein